MGQIPLYAWLRRAYAERVEPLPLPHSPALARRIRRRLLPFASVFGALAALAAFAAFAAVSLSFSLPADAAEIRHVVAKGQTLGRIAKRYNVPVDAIRAVNDLRPGQQIHPGLVLVIPEKGKEAEAAKKAAALRQKQGKNGKEKGKPGEKDKGKEPGDKGGKDSKDGRDAADKGKTSGKDKAGSKLGSRANEKEGYAKKPKRPGFVTLIRGSEKLETQLLTRHGRLIPAALTGVSRMLRFGPTGAKIPVDPRLATLLGMVSDHFGGRPIHIVSGYRPYSPRQYTRHSKHNAGHAVDFSVEGVPNTVVRDFCRSFRNAGVGYYPNSTFVHMDVRTTKVYWVDYSRPGEPPRYDSHRAQADADEAAGDVEEPEVPGAGGSRETSPPDSQEPDKTNGSRSAPGLEAPPQRAPGHVDPPPTTPSPAPAPAAPAAPAPTP
jgi:uncharacterized protein YcbK (DUF882 family)